MAKDNNDDGLVIDLPSEDITIGFDGDGLPKTVAQDPAPAKAKPVVRDEEPSEPKARGKDRDKEPESELAIMRREREAERAAAREAQERLTATTNARLQAETERRKRAEAEAEKRTGQAMEAYRRTVTAERDSVENMIVSHRSEIAQTKDKIKQAYDSGQFDALPDLQERLGTLTAADLQLQTAKRNVESELVKTESTIREVRSAPREPEPEPEVQRQEQPQKKVTPDDWIAQFPRKTRTWLSSNKDYVTDPEKHKQLMEFSKEFAEDYGNHTLHTPAFIEALNQKFAASDEADMEDEEPRDRRETKPAPTQSAPARKAVSAAPVSRGGNYFSSRNMDARSVRLPPALAKFVRDSGLDPTKYAEGAIADIKSGKLPKNFLDPDYDHG